MGEWLLVGVYHGLMDHLFGWWDHLLGGRAHIFARWDHLYYKVEGN